jgi:hypothetical protein
MQFPKGLIFPVSLWGWMVFPMMIGANKLNKQKSGES